MIFLNLTLKILKSWISHDPFTQSAATAYYAIFSLPGLLIIIFTIASFFMERQDVQQDVMQHIGDVIGEEGQENLKEIVSEARQGKKGVFAMITGGMILLLGATGVFVQLQRSLNNIWDTEVRKSAGLFSFLLDRLTSLGIVIAIGFLLIISLTVTAIISYLTNWLQGHSYEIFVEAASAINTGLSFVAISLLFSIIFKVLPDVTINWRYCLYGGLTSGFLFTTGEYLLQLYFETAEPGSVFGAAGSVILVMLWVYFSCMVLLIGAECTKITSEHFTGKKAEVTGIAKNKS